VPESEADATEREILFEFLDYQREALIGKLEGLSDEDGPALCTPWV